MITSIARLRQALPQIAIADHDFAIGYWLRVAGAPRPTRASRWKARVIAEERQARQYGIVAGWERADRELAADATADTGPEVL